MIFASTSIGEGNFDAKVPEVKTDRDLETLNKNFNLMIDKLKSQQEKLIINERHEAWENLARKLAHEIKNPLTPIKLTIDRLKNKYSNELNSVIVCRNHTCPLPMTSMVDLKKHLNSNQ